MSEMISSDLLRRFLSENVKEKVNITVKEVSQSTNSDVKKAALDGEREGTVVVALSQTSGRGRMGRSFFSPDCTGVYMSVLLRPEIQPEETLLITTAAAVSVCETLDKIGADGSAIKWVNDIFLNSKKVCGILTEGGFASAKKIDYAVLGVGINLFEPKNGFPDDLEKIAGAVFESFIPEMRERFIANFLNIFFEYYDALLLKKHVQKYRERCFIVGSQVDVVRSDTKCRATVLGIDDKCCLEVEYSNGEKEILTSGEVSLRLSE